MTYAYDPQTPYAVVGKFSRNVIARFSYLTHAQDFGAPDDWEVIDTTPKPKIPEDARFITWVEPVWDGFSRWYAEKTGEDEWADDTGDVYTLSRLMVEIGDAEVTVLVPKEES